MQGLIGRKVGMTRVFDEESGRSTPVTIIQADTNVVHQVKTVERDGYSAVQLGFGPVSEKRVNKARAGHFKKSNSVPTRVVREVALDSEDEQVAPGSRVGVEILDGIDYVDVEGTSKGRGYAGTIKKYGFHRGRETHGNKNHRERGSLGAGTYPGRVFPGLKMAGQYGNRRTTAKRLEIVRVDRDAGLVYVRGSVPGPRKGFVLIRKNTTL